eukprot:gb/GEZN01000817.1/.p1 GENE.gb/GEZN01000817.1/~~gb/GEZN01000817.1/.p1  ORF type:complete len:1137 (-),score=196.58 gb/GEZN01000817.1/:144-3554(-)
MLSLSLLLGVVVPLARGHGYLTCPKPRQYRNEKPVEWTNWMGITVPGDASFNPGEGNAPNLNSAIGGGPAGESVMLSEGHGLCGDVASRGAFMSNGQYGAQPAKGVYQSGGIMDIQLKITAYHSGWFEFRLCVPADGGLNYNTPETQECFNQHVLKIHPDTPDYPAILNYVGMKGISGTDGGWYKCANSGGHLDPTSNTPQDYWPIGTCCNNGGACSDPANNDDRYVMEFSTAGHANYHIVLAVPAGIQCERCTLQWTYQTANSRETYPETFWNCADVKIVPSGAAIATGCAAGEGGVTGATSTTAPTSLPTNGPTAAPTSPPSGVLAWSSANVPYVIGNLVSYQGNFYRCIQSHNSNAGWDPVSAFVLWQPVSTATTAPTNPPSTTTPSTVAPITTAPTTSSTTTISTTTSAPTTVAPTSPPSGVLAWSSANVPYVIGNLVSYQGNVYRCIQSHNSNAGWDPVSAFVLWQKVSTATTAPTDPPSSSTTVLSTAVPTSVTAAPTTTTITATTPTTTSAPTTATTSPFSSVLAWSSANVLYTAGSLVTYQGKIYQCLQTHNSNSGWTPVAAFTLWQDVGSIGSTQAPTAAPTSTSTTNAPVTSTTGAHATTTTTTTTTFPTSGPTTTTTGPSGDVIAQLETVDPSTILLYEAAQGQWAPSTVYLWPDMIKALREMAKTGVNGQKVWLGNGSNTYGLVNIAAFLAQSMKETIKYNVCDENNWDSTSGYAASNACGQLGQSYQDYRCPAGEEHMECAVDPEMTIRASTSATWYGAPAPLFCAPKSLLPESPKWNYGAPWCDPNVPRNTDMTALEYLDYLKNPNSNCLDYPGQKAGGFDFVPGGAPNSPAPNFGRGARTDVEGCCWWGRGVIQTTGVCNIGKLNYFLGKKAADRNGGQALYSDVDFCKQPDAICANKDHPELKWIAGFFYWLNAVQTYDQGGWNYLAELKKWVDAGMPNPSSDSGFIHGVSGIVNRGCHNPPCGSGDLDGGSDRAQNFFKVLKAMGVVNAEAALVAPDGLPERPTELKSPMWANASFGNLVVAGVVGTSALVIVCALLIFSRRRINKQRQQDSEEQAGEVEAGQSKVDHQAMELREQPRSKEGTCADQTMALGQLAKGAGEPVEIDSPLEDTRDSIIDLA